MVTFSQQLRNVTQAIRAARCARGSMIDGFACDDVQSALVQVSLSAMPPGPERDRLLTTRGGLTLPRASVDALISAGRDAITTSEPIRQFLRDYPVPASTYCTASSGH